ncbi:uncharacterized protein C1orf198 homolog [Mercenaria mercenaria]|uniref:uncharacterized protein C1orf198 homolog n=1 Tax=Mercenaria mercenaria TaxID=6596 RepID=UPI00234EE6DC|nr:uncharacterized protein C1orf198 homolog [Mercenaria mercenaria]
MDERALAYFSTINPLARKIIKDERNLKTALKSHWEELNWQEQEALVDDFMVENSVRQKYADTEKLYSYQKSFPKLKVETGEKIVVDFENDFWTWQDEHSAPFNWRTKSQQDLTLDDLEPDVLCSKPASKAKKPESSSNQPTEHVEQKAAENREFSVQSGTSIWESPFLQGVKKPDFLNRSRSTSPTKSSATSRESLMTSRSKTPEEVNYAFSGSMDDLSSSPSIIDERSLSVSSGEIRGTSPSQDTYPVKPSRRKRSTSKSPVKNVLTSSKKSESETGSHSLVLSKDDDELAFDNPVLGNNWSTFVNGQDEEELSSATPSPYKSLLKEPEPIGIDRGENIGQQTTLLSGSHDSFQDEFLCVETSIDENQTADGTDGLNESSLSKTGFDFLDNW